jgi:GDPmannose 4,6-dehydratase
LDFVTRKITHTIAKIKIALENNKPLPILKLGNLEAQRDWSDAEDFMEGVWLMLNQDKPENYVLGSGEMFTVRHFLNTCLSHADIKFYPEGESDSEKYYTESGQLFFEVDPKFYRPAEVHKLCGDPSKAESELGWKRKTSFEHLVLKMYNNDYAILNG